MEVVTVEGALGILEHFGFIKIRKDDTLIYKLEGKPGKGRIHLTGSVESHYLITCDVLFKQDFVYGSHIREPFIELSSVSDSKLLYEQEREGTTSVLKGMTTHINLGEPNVINIAAGTRLTYTSLIIRQATMTRFLSDEGQERDLALPGNARIINSLPPCHRQARILSDLIHCRMQGSVKALYYEIKALELLCLLSEALSSKKQSMHQSTAQERAAVKEAREILANNISCPPGISALARKVGINATRLKQAFKQETGQTIFGYLRLIRLGTAISLMADPRATIASVSQEVGYRSPSKFSAAFRQQYGLNPGQYLRMVRQRPE